MIAFFQVVPLYNNTELFSPVYFKIENYQLGKSFCSSLYNILGEKTFDDNEYKNDISTENLTKSFVLELSAIDFLKFINLCETSPVFRNFLMENTFKSEKHIKFTEIDRSTDQLEIELNNSLKSNFLLTIKIRDPDVLYLNYNWSRKLQLLVNEFCELENALAWLSTLGGAYSSLGESFTYFAEKAEKTSYHQLKLAIKLGDPSAISRCKIYIAISLIQRNYLNAARNIILEEYKFSQNECETSDPRLPKMCKGVWSRLQYLQKLKKGIY